MQVRFTTTFLAFIFAAFFVVLGSWNRHKATTKHVALSSFPKAAAVADVLVYINTSSLKSSGKSYICEVTAKF
jgi:hypothetical protein